LKKVTGLRYYTVSTHLDELVHEPPLKYPLVHRFSKCSERSPRAPREKPRSSASFCFFCFYF